MGRCQEYTLCWGLYNYSSRVGIAGVLGVEGSTQFMSTDAHFGMKIGFKFRSLGKISNISTSDPQFF